MRTLDFAFHGVKACRPAMKSGGGTIVNIGGRARIRLEKPRPCAHRQSRPGRLHPRARARSWPRPHHHHACAGRHRHHAAGLFVNPAHHLTHGTIDGERGRPDDVAAMVRFLCGPGGRYVTGQTIHVSGGAFLG